MGVLEIPSILPLDISRPPQVFGDPASPRAKATGWDVLGSVPVPLRHMVRDGVASLVADLRHHGGPALKCCFPMGQGGTTPFQRLRYVRDLDAYPDMLVSAEGANLFNRAFHRRFVEGGEFCAAQPSGVDEVFTRAGLVDPKGWIGVYAVAPFVLLVDQDRLGPLPVPRRWADLADPVYAGQVVFGGWRAPGERRYGAVNSFFLHCMAHELGLGGLARILANAPCLLHSAQMPRLAGTDAAPGGIMVAPLSLADMCPRRHRTQIVWPEDGALAYPLWLTVKRSRRQELAPLVEHFHGPDLAALLNANRYPALCPGQRPPMPAWAKLKWPGWDFVRDPESAAQAKAVRKLFLYWQEYWACG